MADYFIIDNHIFIVYVNLFNFIALTAKNIYAQDAYLISTTNEQFKTIYLAVKTKLYVEMQLINSVKVVDIGKSSAADV